MRIIVCLVVYFILANAGDSILDALGMGIGDAYGPGYFSAGNIGLSGVIVSSVLSFISATVLVLLDEDSIAFFIACAFWVWQIWEDYGDRAELGGTIFFVIYTLENIIMLVGLVIMYSVRVKMKNLHSSWKKSVETETSETLVRDETILGGANQQNMERKQDKE